MIININAKDDDAATDFLTSNVDDDEIINAQGFLSAANFIINFLFVFISYFLFNGNNSFIKMINFRLFLKIILLYKLKILSNHRK